MKNKRIFFLFLFRFSPIQFFYQRNNIISTQSSLERSSQRTNWWFEGIFWLQDLTDEAQSKDSERIKLAERLKKEESTLSDNEKEEILKKVQTLYQSIQLLSQQIQAKEQEVTQKLQADQAEVVQKVVNELIKAKKIKMLLNSQALLAFDRADEKVNLTPEVVDLINKEQKK